MSKELKHYGVYSPQIEMYPQDEINPAEHGCCYVAIAAHNKREAISAAIKHPDFKEWVEWQRADGASPFVGVKAEDEKCPHGVCWCDLCDPTCAACDAEFELEEAQCEKQQQH